MLQNVDGAAGSQVRGSTTSLLRAGSLVLLPSLWISGSKSRLTFGRGVVKRRVLACVCGMAITCALRCRAKTAARDAWHHENGGETAASFDLTERPVRRVSGIFNENDDGAMGRRLKAADVAQWVIAAWRRRRNGVSEHAWALWARGGGGYSRACAPDLFCQQLDYLCSEPLSPGFR